MPSPLRYFDPYPGLAQPSILNHSLEGVDRHLLYPAMGSLLQNDDALVRYGLAPYLDQLTDRDLAVMLPAIVKAIEEMAPSDEMFADGIRTAGLDLLSRLHIREGMDAVRIDDRMALGERFSEAAGIPQALRRPRQGGLAAVAKETPGIAGCGEDIRQVHRRHRSEQGFADVGGPEGFYRTRIRQY